MCPNQFKWYIPPFIILSFYCGNLQKKSLIITFTLGKLVAFAGTSQKISVFHKIIGGAILTPAIQQLSGHLSNIVCLKFMPDNAILVSASSDGRILLWDPLEGSLKQTISIHFPIPNYVFPSEVSHFFSTGCQVAAATGAIGRKPAK